MKKLILVISLMGMMVSQVKATSLVLSQVPKEVEAKTSFEVLIDFLTSSKNTTYYLAGVFYKTKGSNLFGLTEVTPDNFVSLTASPSSFFEIKTDEGGSFSGKIKVKAGIDDKGFVGEADYYLRVDRYTGKSANPAESSNEQIIKLLYTPPPTPKPSSPTSDIRLNPPDSSPKTTSDIITVFVTPEPTIIPTPVPARKVASAAAILGIIDVNLEEIATPESDIYVASDAAQVGQSTKKTLAPWIILGGSLLMAGGIIPASLKLFPKGRIES